jgi:hypothetical protein
MYGCFFLNPAELTSLAVCHAEKSRTAIDSLVSIRSGPSQIPNRSKNQDVEHILVRTLLEKAHY